MFGIYVVSPRFWVGFSFHFFHSNFSFLVFLLFWGVLYVAESWLFDLKNTLEYIQFFNLSCIYVVICSVQLLIFLVWCNSIMHFLLCLRENAPNPVDIVVYNEEGKNTQFLPGKLQLNVLHVIWFYLQLFKYWTSLVWVLKKEGSSLKWYLW